MTYGDLAVALFFYILLSGILLAIPFDIKSPYTSISNILILNPWASLIRNLHFFSSQFFLVVSLLHFYDHFHKRQQIGLKIGLGFRLSLGVLIIFLAMLSGFLLRADADAQQARQIIQSLSERIPFIGELLASTLLGKEGDYQLIYVHHLATFSIFLAVIILEHSKKIWPGKQVLALSFIPLMLLSYFYSAPLHDNMNPSVKGPWYFVGFQEILHWLSHPLWSIALVIILLILIFWANVAKKKGVFFSKRILLIFTGFYLFLTIIGLFFRGENWQFIYPGQSNYTYSVLNGFITESVNFSPEFTMEQSIESPLLQGRKESCLVCHNKIDGFSDAHKPEAIGCFSCHGGNPFATRKDQAHHNMILLPGNFETANQSCGTMQCHPDINERKSSNLMANLSGMISVDRFVFNEQETPDSLTDVELLGNSAADEHLRNLCVICHLGNPKTEVGPVSETSRGGGCLACHLNYSQLANEAFINHQKNTLDTTYLNHHASLNLQISDDHCFGCHSRSGRISTNYEGWHETTLEAKDMPDSIQYRLVEGERVFTFIKEDIHHELGMECIDCHHSYELMGDGKRYKHQEEQEDVQCIDCHFNGTPKLIDAEDLDNETALIAAIRYGNFSDRKFLLTNKQNHALVNTFYKDDSAFLIRKKDSKVFNLTSPSPECIGNEAHKYLSCSSCHTEWAPTCIGCHNKYDENEAGYNMLTNKEKQGTWVEFIGEYNSKAPSLGKRVTGNGKEIIPVVPGMVLTIDKSSYSENSSDSTIFHRLFAPSAPHTTSSKGRSCKSCHTNPVALGYGEGSLNYLVINGKGNWAFSSTYENDLRDQLPLDAWTGFLKERRGNVSTRSNVFPFDIEEQQKILRVGACLSCHEENSTVMKQSLNNFSELLLKRSAYCILPEWE